MREINFNVWDKECQIMRSFDEFMNVSVASLFENDNFVLLQDTGLKDKNGVKICEGHIVTACWYSHKEPACGITGKVIFNNDWLSFCIWEEETKTMSEMNAQGYYYWDIEVIGNVYENEELLK